MKTPSNIVFGVQDPLPLVGFPPGRARIRQRNNDFVQVFIYTHGHGIRRFYVIEHGGAWHCSHEAASNTTSKVNQ